MSDFIHIIINIILYIHIFINMKVFLQSLKQRSSKIQQRINPRQNQMIPFTRSRMLNRSAGPRPSQNEMI